MTTPEVAVIIPLLTLMVLIGPISNDVAVVTPSVVTPDTVKLVATPDTRFADAAFNVLISLEVKVLAVPVILVTMPDTA